VIYGVLLWGLVARGGGDMLAPLSGYGTSVQAEKVHIAFEKIKSKVNRDAHNINDTYGVIILSSK
jgi:thiol:disulfide interchange protein DsbD